MVKSEIELSVVVPAYNEAERIPKTLRRLHEYLGANSFAYEILVVLDGPIDSTREVLREMLFGIPHLKVIDRPVNRGKGLLSKKGCSGRAVAYVSSWTLTIPLISRILTR